LGVVAKTKTKTKKMENAMLVRIDQNSATVTPFGSLGGASYNASANGGEQSLGRRSSAIRLAWRWICHLFAPA